MTQFSNEFSRDRYRATPFAAINSGRTSCLGAGHHAVQDRCSLAAVVATQEQIILAADYHSADDPHTEIVVHAECSVLAVAGQSIPSGLESSSVFRRVRDSVHVGIQNDFLANQFRINLLRFMSLRPMELLPRRRRP